MLGREKIENYLKVILRLQERNRMVRAVEIASELGVSRATVSVALKDLRQFGYITLLDDRGILLTEEGRTIAQTVTERYRFFSEMLRTIGISPKTADQDACYLEHGLSQETFDALREYFGTK
ncbi:MAG: metal-dependent transcriptional regulator [Oscillospiraceae bacterium]|nr:metal-dependent transcriptional regulator [Oscillospiraceae bacterium]